MEYQWWRWIFGAILAVILATSLFVYLGIISAPASLRHQIYGISALLILMGLAGWILEQRLRKAIHLFQ